MKKSLLDQALHWAILKCDSHSQQQWKHFSFLVQNNKIIEWATNNNGTPPIHFGYHNRINDLKYKPKIHSEVSVYNKGKGLLKKNKPFELINIRLNRFKELRLSKPCNCCFQLLSELGCSKFYYSDTDGFYEVKLCGYGLI